MSQLIGDWLKTRKLRTFSDRQSLWAQIDRFAKEAHNSLDVKETAFTIANEGRRLIGCDRLSVTVKKGIKHFVEAVSGQDTLDTRSNVVVLLRKLTDRVCAAGEPLWYNGQAQDLPPQIENALQEYIDESHTKSLAIVPIRKHEEADDPDEMGQDESVTDEAKGDVIGALIVEQIDAPQSRDLLAPKVELVQHHSARALRNSLDHNNLFLMPVWRTLGRAKLLVKAKTLPKTLFFSALTLIALISMFLPWQFRLKAQGTLEAVRRAEVYASVDGLIEDVPVKHGDVVGPGERLVSLQSEQLRLQLIDVQGKLASAEAQYGNIRDAIRRDKTERSRSARGASTGEMRGQLAQTRADLDSYQKQFESIQSQLQMLQINSPEVDGVTGWEVTTWDLNRMLPKGRPVAAGQRVMQLADTSEGADWELIVFLPEQDLGHFLTHHFEAGEANRPDADQLLKEKKIGVTYVLLNSPNQQLSGTLVEIQRTAELVEEEGVCYRLRVDIDENDLDQPRPGAEVIARVHCGKRALGFVLFHDAWEWVQTNLFF